MYVVKEAVDDIDDPAGVAGNSLRHGKIARPVAMPAEGGKELAGKIEYLHPEVHGIHHAQASGRKDIHVRGEIELAVFHSSFTEGKEEITTGIESVYRMRKGVNGIEDLFIG